jgi:hypothetical protein
MGVNIKREMAENFFKLWIPQKELCVTVENLWTSVGISKGKI